MIEKFEKNMLADLRAFTWKFFAILGIAFTILITMVVVTLIGSNGGLSPQWFEGTNLLIAARGNGTLATILIWMPGILICTIFAALGGGILGLLCISKVHIAVSKAIWELIIWEEEHPSHPLVRAKQWCENLWAPKIK